MTVRLKVCMKLLTKTQFTYNDKSHKTQTYINKHLFLIFSVTYKYKARHGDKVFEIKCICYDNSKAFKKTTCPPLQFPIGACAHNTSQPLCCKRRDISHKPWF